MNPRGRPIPALILAVMGISTAAVLVRLVPEVTPVSIAFWRTAAVALLLSPALALTPPGRRFPQSPRLRWLTALAGLLLAAHFWAWFTSLQHTTVLRSTILVCLSPIWAALFEWAFLGRAPGWRHGLGVAVAVAGIAVMSGGTLQASGQNLWMGDGLATLGGMLSAGYLVVGRAVRPHVDIGPYGSVLCAITAAWLFIVALASDVDLLDIGRHEALVLAGMALGPQLLGHIGLNYAVRYVPAAIVSSVVLLEPIGAAALAALVLAEFPNAMEILGSVVVLGGLGVATIRSSR